MNENNKKYYEKISEDLCGICYEEFKDPNNIVYCLKCPNLYHPHCMINWCNKSTAPKKKCPYCSRRTLKYPKKQRTVFCFPFCIF
jgi:hypothetical protein